MHITTYHSPLQKGRVHEIFISDEELAHFDKWCPNLYEDENALLQAFLLWENHSEIMRAYVSSEDAWAREDKKPPTVAQPLPEPNELQLTNFMENAYQLFMDSWDEHTIFPGQAPGARVAWEKAFWAGVEAMRRQYGLTTPKTGTS